MESIPAQTPFPGHTKTSGSTVFVVQLLCESEMHPDSEDGGKGAGYCKRLNLNPTYSPPQRPLDLYEMKQTQTTRPRSDTNK